MSHPARFSVEIIDVIRDVLLQRWPEWMGRPKLWDCYAGTGERLEALARELDFDFGGTEIEPVFIVSSRIQCGDATDPLTYPARPWVSLTSPVYPSGMADSWAAADESYRNTYRAAKTRLLGEDVGLCKNNMGALGYRGTKRGGKSAKRRAYWDLADRTVANWSSAELVLLNVSDFHHTNGEVEPVVDDWKQLLAKHGWRTQTDIPIGTRRLGFGANRDERPDNETLVVAER